MCKQGKSQGGTILLGTQIKWAYETHSLAPISTSDHPRQGWRRSNYALAKELGDKNVNGLDDYMGVHGPMTDKGGIVREGTERSFPVSGSSLTPVEPGAGVGVHTRLIPKVREAGFFCRGAL